ncbi:MAG: alkylphosphonate utilization protein [Flavobacteriaceae bacterium]
MSDFDYLYKNDTMDVKDANGNILKDRDTVKLTKDLKLKGTSTTIKRGTAVKNIRLTESPDEIDCRVNKMSIVLRTEFVKK